MTKEELAKLLKKARENRGYTQLEIADLLSYTPQNVSLWEVGKISLKLDVFFNYCNIVKYDPYSIIEGKLIEDNHNISLDYSIFIGNLNYLIEKRTISKKELIWTLGISYPTLIKVLKEDLIIYVDQYIRLCDYLKIDVRKLLSSKLNQDKAIVSNVKKISLIRKASFISVCMSCISVILVLSILLVVKNNQIMTLSSSSTTNDLSSSSNNVATLSTSSTQVKLKEDTPNIEIDYHTKKLAGFEANSSYLINDESFKMVSEEIEIKTNWYDKNVSIIKVARDEQYENSEVIKLFINSQKFENYYKDSDYVDSALIDENLNEKLTMLSSYDEDLNDTYYTLTSQQKMILSDNLEMELPNLKDDYFEKPLSSFLSDEYQFNYEIKTETNNGNENKYVEINSVKDSSITKLYIPKTVEQISDIRIASYAFEISKNPNLVEIVFEEKPSYLGDYAFKGLSLEVLDFGVNDDLNKRINVTVQPYSNNSNVNYSNALSGIKKISKARLPLRFYRDTDKNGYSYSTINYLNLFGDTRPLNNSNFNGIYSLIFPNPVNDNNVITNEMLAMNCKIYSIYVPKGLNFYYGVSDTKLVDLYLRLVRFQNGYEYKSTNYEIKGKDSTSKFVEIPNYYTLLGFERCYALEYVIFEDNNQGSFLRKNMYNGCVSLKGCIDYSNVMLVGTSCFQGANLPSKIELKKVFKINANAFKDCFNLTQIDIYKSDVIDSNYPLTIQKGAFSYSSNYSLAKLEKIVFHNFSEDELDLAENYKDSSIQAEFIND